MAKTKKEPATKDDASDGSVAVNDAWTGMLAISLLALAVGTGFLAWDYLQYTDDPPRVQPFSPPKAPAPAPAPPPAPAADAGMNGGANNGN